MKVLVLATHTCNHRPLLERELRHLGIAFETCYVEECPDLAARLCIRHSPNLVVDDTVVFRGLPGEGALRAYFSGRRASMGMRGGE